MIRALLPRVLALVRSIDPAAIIAIVGAVAVVKGIADVYRPAAWIVAGAMLLAFAAFYDRGRRVQSLIESMRSRES